jgi:tetratricopeptide (TPR) repeat protein
MLRVAPVVLLVFATHVFATHALAAGSGPVGGGSMPGGGGVSSRTPEQLANSAYKSGQKYKKRALRYEDKAAQATDAGKRDKLSEKAQAQYEKAVDAYLEAFRYDREHYQALNELGYAYRKIGNYDDAVRAYNTALTIKPDFAPAIEYRGEAFLALGLFDHTKEAYMTLFRSDQDQAALLMRAMEAWLDERDAGAGPDAEAFAAWIEERRTLADATQTLSMNSQRDW